MGQVNSNNLPTRSTTQCPGPNNLPPLQFHQVHGDNIRLYRDGKMAKRYESFCKGITFSARPVKTNERVFVKFSEISNNWSGVIRFGFTYNDPAQLRNSLPKYACPDLTNRPGYWAKALNERFCEKDNILFYYVTAAGDVHFGINGEEKGVFITGVETRGPLWTLIDIYGNCSAIEFLDSRVCMYHQPQQQQQQLQQQQQQQRRRSLLSSSATIAAELESERMQASFQSMNLANEETPASIINRNTGGCMLSSSSSSSVSNTTAAAAAAAAASAAAITSSNLAIAQQHHQNQQLQLQQPLQNHHHHLNLHHHHLHHNNNNNNNINNHQQQPQQQETGLIPIPFHRTKGRNVMLSSDRFIATRSDSEFCQGYVFTARPIRIGERIHIQVLRTETMYVGALALGLTSCDPATLTTSDLPDDSDMLLDRPEYWVVSKDVAATPNRGDEIIFCVTQSGEVQISKNRGPAVVVMHVDQSLQLWAFLDIYGSTQSVRILSQSCVTPITTPTNSTNSICSVNNTNSNNTMLPTSPRSRLHVHLPTSESINSLNSQASLQLQQQLQQNQQLELQMQQQRQNGGSISYSGGSCNQLPQQQQQQQQQHHQSQQSLSQTSRVINVPTNAGDMIQIQPGGTVLVVNLPPAHSSIPDLTQQVVAAAAAVQSSSSTVSVTNQSSVNALHQQQQQQQQQQQTPIATTSTTTQQSCAAIIAAAENAAQSRGNQPVNEPATSTSCQQQQRLLATNPVPPPSQPPQSQQQNYNNSSSIIQWQDSTSSNHTTGAECTICYENPIDSVLYTCGHMCMCYDCAIQQWRGMGGGHCPLCRAVIRDVIRTYKS